MKQSASNNRDPRIPIPLVGYQASIKLRKLNMAAMISGLDSNARCFSRPFFTLNLKDIKSSRPHQNAATSP
jgi:hypothetical protein